MGLGINENKTKYMEVPVNPSRMQYLGINIYLRR
jgi:hypothetical protein